MWVILWLQGVFDVSDVVVAGKQLLKQDTSTGSGSDISKYHGQSRNLMTICGRDRNIRFGIEEGKTVEDSDLVFGCSDRHGLSR